MAYKLETDVFDILIVNYVKNASCPSISNFLKEYINAKVEIIAKLRSSLAILRRIGPNDGAGEYEFSLHL